MSAITVVNDATHPDVGHCPFKSVGVTKSILVRGQLGGGVQITHTHTHHNQRNKAPLNGQRKTCNKQTVFHLRAFRGRLRRNSVEGDTLSS